MVTSSRALIVGWEEWVALPDLGLPAIKAKIDTGARTSALHADPIEVFGPADAPSARFTVHPIPGRSDVAIAATAPVIDRREVTSSNGERELRYVIKTRLAIGAESWPIELTLTNRDAMSYRMLIGRQAIRDDMYVDPTSSFRQPRLSYKVYHAGKKRRPTRDSLHIALLTRKPLSPSNRRIAEFAAARGHSIDILEPDRLAIPLGQNTPLQLNGRPLEPFDAVIPRIGPGPFGAAVVRHLEAQGAVSMNGADALDRLRSPLAAAQVLAAAGLPTVLGTVTAEDWSTTWRTAADAPDRVGVCVIGDTAVAAASLGQGEPLRLEGEQAGPHLAMAERAARALGLWLSRIDLVARGERLCVAGISTTPDLARYERLFGRRLAEPIIADVESRARMERAARG